MGIQGEPLRLLKKTVAEFLKPKFSVLEFGDQWVTAEEPHRLAAELYQELGAGYYVSVDGNGRGTLTFDLNRKVGELLPFLPARHQAFDLVTDFGTGEHIFDQATFWRTLHALTKPGGLIIFDRPSQGYPGHCFWRTDYSTYRDIAEANDYDVLALAPREARHGGECVMGVLRKTHVRKFIIPNQGRYQKLLRPIRGRA